MMKQQNNPPIKSIIVLFIKWGLEKCMLMIKSIVEEEEVVEAATATVGS